MNQYEAVITHCRHLEHLLEVRLGAQGRGLHEKTTSVESWLAPRLVGKLRFIASARNRLVHEHTNRVPIDLADYVAACNWAAQEIERLASNSPPQTAWFPPAATSKSAKKQGFNWWWVVLLVVILNYRGCDPQSQNQTPTQPQPAR